MTKRTLYNLNEQVQTHFFERIKYLDPKVVEDYLLLPPDKRPNLRQYFDQNGHNALHSAIYAPLHWSREKLLSELRSLSTEGLASLSPEKLLSLSTEELLSLCSAELQSLFSESLERRRAAIMDWLLTELEIDPNQPTGNKAGQDTALHLAAKLGITAAVDRLVECNTISIDAEIDCKKTPLHYAVEGFNFSIIKTLITHGADPEKKDICQHSVLHKVAYLLLNTPFLPVDLKDKHLDNILIKMQLLLESVYTPRIINLTDGNKNTVSHLLATCHLSSPGFTQEVFQLLEKKEANFELKNQNGNTVLLMGAAQRPSEASKTLIELLLMKGYSPNMTNHNKENLLHLLALYSRNKGLIKLALEKGANPYLKDENGRTAEAVSREEGNNEIAELLRCSKKYFLNRKIKRAIWIFFIKIKKLFNKLNKNPKFENLYKLNAEDRRNSLYQIEDQTNKTSYYFQNIISASSKPIKKCYSWKLLFSCLQPTPSRDQPNEIEPRASTSRPQY